ncbi:hypothetical protein [Terriglobus sp. RCC_193]|uniref:hypothetical protein n=1 Tax=Terriglobus sp. RCC_193 TaxID=3239218 RepID=UPI0035267269
MIISKPMLITISALLCAPIPLLAQDRNLVAATNSTQQQVESQELKPSWISSNVSMGERSDLNLGVSASYGHDSAVNNIPDVSSQFSNIQGTLGMARRSRTSYLSLRHDATFQLFPGSGLDMQQYQWTTLNLTHSPSRNTTWGVNAANAYGADSARASSSLSLAAVNTTSIDNNSVLAGVITGNTLRQYVSGVVDHQVSESQAFSLGANVSFQNFLGAAPSTRQYNVTGSVRKYLSQAFLIGVRADGVQQYYGSGSCTTSSLLGFATMQLSSAVRLDGGIGPAFGSSQCTGNYQYQALLSAQSVRGRRAYVGTSRKRGNGDVAGSLWETSGFGGMQVGNPRQFVAAVNGGYTSYHGGVTSAQSTDLSGYFVSVELHRPISNNAEWTFTARRFQRSVTGPAPASTTPVADLARTVFFVAFTWQKQNGGRYGR